MSFYREGINEYRVGRYINAFFNFYFIIEGLFANGKSGANDVVREYTASEVLMSLVEGIFKVIASNDDESEGATRQQLENQLNARAQPLSPEGLVKLLVKKRGELHHFSLGSSRQQGTPLNHGDYKLIAFIVQELAAKSLVHKIGEAEASQNASQLSPELSKDET